MRILIKSLAFFVLLFSAFLLYDREDMRTPVAFEALHQIDPLPKTKELISQNKLLEAEEYLSFFMNYDYMKEVLEAKNLLIDIKAKRSTKAYKMQSMVDGVVSGRSEELEGQIAAGISDFFLLGDLRDLSIEGYHHFKGEEVDEVLVALSSIGVLATGMTLVTAGTSAPIKGSLSSLKLAKKSGKLTDWLGKELLKIAKNKNLQKSKILFNDLFLLMKGAGVSGGLKLLQNTKGLGSFKEAVTFSKVYGKNSTALVTVLGKDTVKLQKGVSKEAFIYAASYGKVGVKRLKKLGEKGFLKSLVRPIKTSRVAKLVDKNVANILKSIPDRVLFLVGFIALMVVM